MGVGRRGRCGQDFLEKGDPGVWGREVTLGLKPIGCQTHITHQAHNSRETRNPNTRNLTQAQKGDTDGRPTKFHFRAQANVTDTPPGPCRLSAHIYRDKGLPGTQQTCDPGRHAWLHTGNSSDTPVHRQQVRPRNTWTHRRCRAGVHSAPDPAHAPHRVPRGPRHKQARVGTLRGREGRRGCTWASPRPRIPCPALGNSKAHMTQGEGFWNSLRRNCIILTNDPFPSAPGNKGSETASSAQELTCLSEPPADWLVPPPG